MNLINSKIVISILKFIFKIFMYITSNYMLYYLYNRFNELILEIYQPSLVNEKNKFLFTSKILYYISLILLLLLYLGVKQKSIITFFGGISLVIAYSVQEYLVDLTSGIILAFNKEIEIKDYVEINDDIKGFINEINLIRTVICDRNNQTVSIQNQSLIQNNVKIFKYNHPTFFNIKLNIPYKSEYIKIKEHIRKLLHQFKKDGKILKKESILLQIENNKNISFFFKLKDSNLLQINRGQQAIDRITNRDLNKIFIIKNDVGYQQDIILKDIDTDYYTFNYYSNTREFENIFINSNYIDIISYYNHVDGFESFTTWREEITVDKFDESFVTINVRVKMIMEDRFRVYYEIQDEINKYIINNNIPIAFPQLDLHVIEPVKINKKV